MKQKPILPGKPKSARPVDAGRKAQPKPKSVKAQIAPAGHRKQLRREIGNR